MGHGTSFIIWRHLVFNVSQQRDPHLGSVIPPQDITNVMYLNLHLDLSRRDK